MTPSSRRARRGPGRAPRRQRALLAGGVVVLVAAVVVPAALAGGAWPRDDARRALPAAAPAPPAGPAAAPRPGPSPGARTSPRTTDPPVPLVVATRPAPDEAVVAAGTGRLAVVGVDDEVEGDGGRRADGATATSGGETVRYLVEVEDGLGLDGPAFASAVDAVLRDPRGWGADGERSFVRVDEGPVDLRVALASPATTDRLCLPLDTAGIFSCEVDGRATLNSARWLQGADAYGDDVVSYRDYLVSHEVGHALGFRHQYGCRPDGLAHVMQQQTKTLAGCAPNPWPNPEALPKLEPSP